MANFVHRFPIRVITKVSKRLQRNYYSNHGSPVLSCHPPHIQSHQMININPLVKILQTSPSYLAVKCAHQLQFINFLSSDSAILDEDDINVYYDSLVKRINSGDIQLIDVREPAELAEFGQITNSVNIPLGDLADALKLPEDKFQDKYQCSKPKSRDDNIVFHCRSGKRSQTAVNIAKEIGYSKARHFPGGWLQWAEKNNLPFA
ncbi:thiosulfate sulfurtransferase/rhodanese-like domain-containing protein 3 [Acanthaster planci]|uniref:Thiosulfate sulfurtransferase/rhodanese-like domain-containing protein 3 n=1 Tax=Acanthaster planci TaxID=133434 RepID=A0A8B7Z5Y4_ACAPL|nr:thiosulfate sulfurtransferase/rhodanese-like domain-containing protein 3 [Acanthaster planci]